MYVTGKGIVLDYRVRVDGNFVTCAYTRYTQRPWSLNGGREGPANRVEVIRSDGSVEEYTFVTSAPRRRAACTA
jgi:N-methylhydantoinase B